MFFLIKFLAFINFILTIFINIFYQIHIYIHFLFIYLKNKNYSKLEMDIL